MFKIVTIIPIPHRIAFPNFEFAYLPISFFDEVR